MSRENVSRAYICGAARRQRRTPGPGQAALARMGKRDGHSEGDEGSFAEGGSAFRFGFGLKVGGRAARWGGGRCLRGFEEVEGLSEKPAFVGHAT